MNTKKTLLRSQQIYVGFSCLSLAYVSLLSLVSPQSTMDLVGVVLPNTDAISSIRGIYGGVGLFLTSGLIYLLFKELPKAVIFLFFFWFSYALSRLITLLVDGPLGDFGNQWIMIETFLATVGFVLLFLSKQQKKKTFTTTN